MLKISGHRQLEDGERDYDNVLDDPMYSILCFRQLEQGEIWINGPIIRNTVSRVNMNLNFLASRSNVDVIKVYINSEGGSLFDSLAIADFIRTVDKPVHTYASGVVMSGGFLIYMAGDVRIAYPFSIFMMHDQRVDYGGMPRHLLQAELEFQDTVNARMVEFLNKRSKISKSQWIKYMNSSKDTYFDVKEATNAGFVDIVVKEKKKITKK